MAYRVSAIIAAGGRGARLPGEIPKPFRELGGRPLLAWGLSAVGAVSHVTEIIIGVAAEQVERTRPLVSGLAGGLSVTVAAGGAERQETVRRCLALVSKDADLVLVHDAARPLVTPDLAEAVIHAAGLAGAATAALRPVDTIKLEDPGTKTCRNLDRASLWQIQTPQVFSADLLRQAHAAAERDGYPGTDDAALVERLGRRVEMVAGSPLNFKITTEDDWRIAAGLVAAGVARPFSR